MRWPGYCLTVLALLSALTVTVYGDDILPPELPEALPPEAEQMMEELDGGAWDHASLLEGLQQLGTYAADQFFSVLQSHLGSGVLMLAVVILCAMGGELYQPGQTGVTVTTAGALAIALTAAGGVRSMIGSGWETIESLNVFSKTLLPSLAAAAASSGGMISASVRQVATVLFVDFLITLIRSLLMPLVYAYVAVSVAEAVITEHPLERLRGGIGKVVAWALAAIVALFTGYLTLTGSAATSSDALALRLTRSAIGAAVPVVGTMISEASESVLAGAGLLKNAIGVFGMLGVLMICVTPFLHLAAQYLVYKVTAFLASLVGSEPLVKLIDSLGTAFALVLGMAGACAVLLLVSVSAAVSAVSG